MNKKQREGVKSYPNRRPREARLLMSLRSRIRLLRLLRVLLLLLLLLLLRLLLNVLLVRVKIGRLRSDRRRHSGALWCVAVVRLRTRRRVHD